MIRFTPLFFATLSSFALVSCGEAAGKWFLEQSTADADFQTKFEESMEGWETEMNAITDGLEDDEHEKVFEKYEIDIGLGDDEEAEEEEESPL